MNQRKKCIAMLLAGGQGSRLSHLTKNLAKPAVPFGGKYRIIDFPLSNCTNSDIDTVGVLTQYKPLVLNSYIGIGSAWDLDRQHGGVSVLPPYMERNGGQWYKGTANAIYQNTHFIESYDPEHVLVLSGDHIYKMDYSKLLDYHIEKGADVTISVIEVSLKEASRFGIMNTDQEYKIKEFEEKPEQPKSNLASMGVYIFKWSILKKYLEMDNRNSDSSHDFGKDVIPLMLDEGLKLYAYPFKGYWKDVGTVQSLWEANMDLLEDEPQLNLYDYNWRIYSVNPNQPPHYIANNAVVHESLVNEGCVVYGEINHSVLFPGVHVGENTVVKDSVIMSGAKIEGNCTIEKAIIGNDMIIKNGTVIRSEDSKQVVLVAEKEAVS